MPSNTTALIYGYEYGSGNLITLGSDKGANFAVDYNGNVTADGTVDGAAGFKVGAAVGADACVKYLEDATPTTRYMKFVKGIYIGKYTDSGCTTP
jgi:hypothetical protein